MDKKKINVLGIISIVFGVIGILTICGCGIGGIFGLVGIILGIVGLVVFKENEKVTSIIGLATSGVALLFGIGWLILYVLPNNSGSSLTNSYSLNVTMENAESDYVGHDFKEVSGDFNDLGFYSVEYVEIGDLTSESTTKDGTVESVSIGGKTDWKQGDSFDKSEKVVISYHTMCSYDTKIIVDFLPNLIFNKYDVNMYLDGEKLESISHGQDIDKTYQIKEGTHTLKFSESGDSSVKGEVELTVKYPTEASYKITCYDKYIDVDEKYVISESPLEEGEIRMTKNASEFKYKDYKDIEKFLSDEGFKNITLVPLYDIYWGVTPEGEIQSVTINGFSDYKKGDIFKEDVEIKISYHMPYDQDPDYVSSSSSSSSSSGSGNSSTDGSSDSSSSDDDDYWEKLEQFYAEADKLEEEIIDKNFVSVRDDLRLKGYNLEYIHENTRLDFTGELDSMTDNELNEYHWICRGIYRADYDTNTLTLIVNSTDNIERLEEQENAEKKLSQKLDPSAALAALEMYGKDEYPYGFQIHMLTGKLGESVYDENTWFMKYYAKYKDWTGQWVECTVEGRITGTTDNPEVVYFIVY